MCEAFLGWDSLGGIVDDETLEQIRGLRTGVRNDLLQGHGVILQRLERDLRVVRQI